MNRCSWVKGDPLCIEYHDQEWGVPVHEDHKLFEFLILEGMQAGLSWMTILRKRENYRRAFDDFDPVKIKDYDEKKIKELMKNEGIIRNRKKIEAIIQNAKVFLQVQKEFGSFERYLWCFVNHKPIDNQLKDWKEVQTTSVESEKLSKDLKKRGFRFVGPTICYAYMQAIGMVNDHTIDCFRYGEVKRME
ncbi:DNA-3-methyladenine glycosylase I [Tepidibacillus fermentans]|uniref:DNA-3-methyladenine glycosylase I n=1 Tax=Tepidibacillus fermentans TaxID=1281767 RepID=A0A4R3KLR3_9BACI|nr:DNA-3-methyladenine glycosylase I [Tepidibacillus fermentans]TCS84376.1 DNA-3-methyladenine glycosylase I [Tepidibacillus fermentans]